MNIVSDINSSASSPQGKGRVLKEKNKDKYRQPTLEAELDATMVRDTRFSPTTDINRAITITIIVSVVLQQILLLCFHSNHVE
jgi:hypothetical protein